MKKDIRRGIRYDVSVGASGDTRIVDVLLGRKNLYSEFPMDYKSARLLHAMLGDALAHLDGLSVPVMERPLKEEDFTTRTWNVLNRTVGLDTVGDLALWTAADLLDLRGFGSRCLREVSMFLSRQGLPGPAGAP